MKNFALVGEGISYSLSPKIHKIIYNSLGVDASYDLIDSSDLKVDIERLKTLDGFNVTKPYKNEIVGFLDKCMFGDQSVNTVTCKRDGKTYLIGYNTDFFGFSRHIYNELGDIAGKNVLVLGAGGVAGVVVRALSLCGAFVQVYNRTKDKAEKLVKIMGGEIYREGFKPNLIVNCTTLGLKNEMCLPPEIDVSLLEACYDTIYMDTPFLQFAAAKGLKSVSGLGMLVYQAIKAETIFLNIDLKIDEIDCMYYNILKELT